MDDTFSLLIPGKITLIQADLVVSHFALWCLKILLYLHSESLWQSSIRQVCLHHFSNSVGSLCVSVTFLWFLHYFKLFHYYYICYGDLWSVIFAVTIVVVLRHEPRTYKIANFNRQILRVFWLPPAGRSPISLPLLGPHYSLRHNNTEIKPVENLKMASKCWRQRKSPISL